MHLNFNTINKLKYTPVVHLTCPPPHEIKSQQGFWAQKHKHLAFSLAEILITLAIVGVLAAITVPSLIAKYEIAEIETGVKTAYKILETAVKASEIDNGPIEKWDLNPNKGCNTWSNAWPKAFAEQYLMPYLDVSYICNSQKQRCFKRYIPNGADSYAGSSGDRVMTYLDPGLGYNFCLKNGMCLSVSCYLYSAMAVTVDINGPGRGPSVMGRDVFRYAIGLRSNRLGRRIPVNPGQSSIYDVAKQNLLKPPFYMWGISNLQCSPGGRASGAQHSGCGGGANCTAVIATNGWKVPKNYPLDKIARKVFNP